MSRAFVLLLALVAFTRPDGSTVWVNPALVTAVGASQADCKGRTRISHLTGWQCVLESPADAAAKINEVPK